ATAVAGAVFMMDKSAAPTKLTRPLAELLEVFGSGVLAETEAVSLTSTWLFEVTVTTIVVRAPAGTVPREHVTTFAAMVHELFGGGLKVAELIVKLRSEERRVGKEG